MSCGGPPSEAGRAASRLKALMSPGTARKVKRPVEITGPLVVVPSGRTLPVMGHHMKTSSGSPEWASERTIRRASDAREVLLMPNGSEPNSSNLTR